MILGATNSCARSRATTMAYCQDNERSTGIRRAQRRYRGILPQGHRAHAPLPYPAAPQVLPRSDLDADQVPDLEWFGAHLDPDWHDPEQRTPLLQLDGSEEALRSATTSCSSSSMPTTSRDGWRSLRLRTASAGADHRHESPCRTGLRRSRQEVLVDPGDHYIANPRSTVVLLGR